MIRIDSLPRTETKICSATSFSVKSSVTPTAVRSAAPQLGEHNHEVFERLGRSAEQIAQWKREGVV